MRTLLLWAAAFALGLFGWRAAAPGSPSERATAPVVAAPAPEAPPLRTAEAREIERKLRLVETVPLKELVLYGKEPLGDRVRRARGLPENERRQKLIEWARRAVYDRAKAQEMLALVREEEDPEILGWLAEMIDVACLSKMNLDPTFTDDERNAIAPLAFSGEPFERRIAALRVVGGDRQSGLPADVQTLLSDVLRRDPEPKVLAAAAEEIEQRYAPDTLPALLDAYRRLPPGEARQRVARSYARWASWPQLKERFAGTRGPEEYDDWARGLFAFGKEGAEGDIPSIYRQTSAKDIRRDFFYRLAASTFPAGIAMMREIADLEPDPDLRERYARVLAAADPKDPSALTKFDVFSALYR